MAIAGLVQDDVRQGISGFPGIARIPVIGTLFRSQEFQRNESELVIIVTPYLVRPTARKNLAQPDENFHPATESASIFMVGLTGFMGPNRVICLKAVTPVPLGSSLSRE